MFLLYRGTLPIWTTNALCSSCRPWQTPWRQAATATPWRSAPTTAAQLTFSRGQSNGRKPCMSATLSCTGTGGTAERGDFEQGLETLHSVREEYSQLGDWPKVQHLAKFGKELPPASSGQDCARAERAEWNDGSTLIRRRASHHSTLCPGRHNRASVQVFRRVYRSQQVSLVGKKYACVALWKEIVNSICEGKHRLKDFSSSRSVWWPPTGHTRRHKMGQGVCICGTKQHCLAPPTSQSGPPTTLVPARICFSLECIMKEVEPDSRLLKREHREDRAGQQQGLPKIHLWPACVKHRPRLGK